LSPNAVVPAGVHDSKLLRPHERAVLYDKLLELAAAGELVYHVATIPAAEIDSCGGIGPAWERGVQQVLRFFQEEEEARPDAGELVVYLDGKRRVRVPAGCPTRLCTLVKADRELVGVAAASILAKESRDRAMVQLVRHETGLPAELRTLLEKSKGYYGRARHAELLRAGYASSFHRRSFEPLKTVLAAAARDPLRPAVQEEGENACTRIKPDVV
jgi:ribonuclease HII